MADIFQEVDEDVRRERLIELWKRYGPPVLIGLGVVLIAWAGWDYWRGEQEKQRLAEATAFAEVAQSAIGATPEEAAAAYGAAAPSLGPGYATLARLREAGALAVAGKRAEAVAAYDAVAADEAADAKLRGLAALQAAIHAYGHDTDDRMLDRLEPLAVPGRPWYFSATELLALMAIDGGDTDSARAHLVALRDDPQAPAATRTRAQELLAVVGPEPEPEVADDEAGADDAAADGDQSGDAAGANGP